MSLRQLHIDKSWTLFLDRDGVINRRIPDDYVKTWNEFEFLPNVLEAFKTFSSVFGKIFVVSNQQGIGKKIMSENDLNSIHEKMIAQISEYGGRIDKVYFCPALAQTKSVMRKPNVGMALKARKDFPDLHFKKSVMVGDSLSDMIFGKRLKMYTVFVGKDENIAKNHPLKIDAVYASLFDFSEQLKTTV